MCAKGLIGAWKQVRWGFQASPTFSGFCHLMHFHGKTQFGEQPDPLHSFTSKKPKVFIFPSLTELPIEIGKGFDWRNFIDLKTLKRGPRWKERRPHVFSKWPQYKASGAKLHGNPTWLKRQKLPQFSWSFPTIFLAKKTVCYSTVYKSCFLLIAR